MKYVKAKSEETGWAARRRKEDWAGHAARIGGLQNNILVIVQEKKARETNDMDKFLENSLFRRAAANRSEWNKLRETFVQK